MPEIISFISCILLVRITSKLSVWVSKFSFPNFPKFYFSLYWLYFYLSCLECFVHFLPWFIWGFIDFFKGLIHFCFKYLYHIHKGNFKVFFLCFSYVAISEPTEVWLLNSHGNILFLFFVFLGCQVGIQLWEDYNFGYNLWYILSCVLCFLVSVVLSGLKSVVVVCCLLESSSEILINLATGGSR